MQSNLATIKWIESVNLPSLIFSTQSVLFLIMLAIVFGSAASINPFITLTSLLAFLYFFQICREELNKVVRFLYEDCERDVVLF
jgi:hypothetical protein